MVWCGLARYGIVWYGTVWYSIVYYSQAGYSAASEKECIKSKPTQLLEALKQ